MITGIDLDGVVYPWHYSVYRYFVEFKGYVGSYKEFWIGARDFAKEILDYYASLTFLYNDTSPTNDVLEYLPKIAELGKIFYITSRPESAILTTEKFFDFYKLPFKENLIFSKDKAMHIKLHKVEYYLDDLPRVVKSVENLTDAYLFSQIHNFDMQEGFNVVHSLKEFYDIILYKSKKKELGFIEQT